MDIMTRETKIGLLVGMGVIILIGILISDHLSEARRQKPAELAAGGSSSGSNSSLSVFSPSTSNLPGVRPGAHNPTAPPVKPNNTQPPIPNYDSPPIKTPGMRFDLDPILKRNNNNDTTKPPVPPTNNNTEDEAIDELRKRLLAEEKRRMEELKKRKAEANRKTVRYHYVVSGDSLSSIARKYYKSSKQKYIDLIYKANRDKMRSRNDLRTRVQLVIPYLATDDTASNTPAKPTNPDNNDKTDSPTVTTRDYKVREGDTLSSIAEEFYGAAKYWRKLAKLNKDRLPNPNRLRPGIILRVPTR